MKEFTLEFSNRERYCKACNILWNSATLEMTCRGRLLYEKNKWYVSFVRK